MTERKEHPLHATTAQVNLTRPVTVVVGVSCMDYWMGGAGAVPERTWPKPGERLAISLEDLQASEGGNGLITAVGLAALGCTVRLHTGLANDPPGEKLLELLSRNGVQVYNAEREPERNISAQSFVITANTSGGQEDPSYLHFYGASSALSASSFGEACQGGLLDGARVVLFLGVGIMPRLDRELEEALLVLRRSSSGAPTTVLDVALLTQAGIDEKSGLVGEVLTMMPKFDIVVPNTDEAEMFLRQRDGFSPTRGTEVERAKRYARELHTMGVGVVIVKCGRFGCVIMANGRGPTHIGSEYKGVVVDTVGAGDSFVAGLVASLCQARGGRSYSYDDLVRACKEANRVAAKSVQYRGGVAWTEKS